MKLSFDFDFSNVRVVSISDFFSIYIFLIPNSKVG
jgi:hypothetical protein